MKIFRLVQLMVMVFTLCAAATASAQDVVRKEAPPEIRALFQALTQAANGDAAAWESFAQAHYTAELLKKQTPEQRAEVHKQIADRFGTIGIGGVRREMDGPLQVLVKGAKGNGTINVELDFSSPKIHSIGVDQ